MRSMKYNNEENENMCYENTYHKIYKLAELEIVKASNFFDVLNCVFHSRNNVLYWREQPIVDQQRGRADTYNDVL